MNILAVLNPVSGGNDKGAILRTFRNQCSFYGIESDIFKTTGENDEQKLSDKIEEFTPDRIIAIGGDGTFALAALEAMNQDIPTGIIPMGSANGLAKELGVKMNADLALEDIFKSHLIRGLDVIEINEKYRCLHLADVGLNANVVEAYDNDPNRGMMTYGKHLVTMLSNMETLGYKIEANGKTNEGKGVMIAIGNGRKFGTGVPVNKCGNPFDGEFEIILVEYVDTGFVLNAGLSILDDGFLNEEATETIQATEAKIYFNSPRLMQIDGEVVGKFKELSICLKKGAIPYITHGDNPYI